MSKFDQIYSTVWLKPSDLDGKPLTLQIESASYQFVGRTDDKEEKLVVAFVNPQKQFSLNQTNAHNLATEWGRDESQWIGRWCEATVVPTNLTPGIRLRPIEPPAEAMLVAVEGSDIPF